MSVPSTGPGIGAPQESASSQAITALILGILGLIMCQLLGPFAWYLGGQELRAIRERRAPAAGESLASIGRILGIIATVLMIIGLVVVFFFGGLAFLAAFFQSRG